MDDLGAARESIQPAGNTVVKTRAHRYNKVSGS